MGLLRTLRWLSEICNRPIVATRRKCSSQPVGYLAYRDVKGDVNDVRNGCNCVCSVDISSRCPRGRRNCHKESWGTAPATGVMPPARGGTNVVVVKVRDGSSSSFRLDQVLVPPPAGGGANAIVQVRDGSQGQH